MNDLQFNKQPALRNFYSNQNKLVNSLSSSDSTPVVII